MKKEFNFSYKEEKFFLENIEVNGKEPMSIDAKKLEFDTRLYYELLFEDVSEEIEITIKNIITDSEIEDVEIKKASKYIYSTIDNLTKELCDKINIECFSSEKEE